MNYVDKLHAWCKMSVVTVTSIDKARALRRKVCYKAPRGMDLGGSALAKLAKQAFLQNLWFWMDYRGVTATELAAGIGVTPAAVSNWKQGISFPQPDLYDKISAFLRVPLFVLFWDPSDPRTKDPRWIATADLVDVGESEFKVARARLMRIREALAPARRGEMPIEDALKIMRGAPWYAGDGDEIDQIAQVLAEHYVRNQADSERATASEPRPKKSKKKAKKRKTSARN